METILENPVENIVVPEAQLAEDALDLKKLRTLRKRMRLNQADAAALIGIHRTYFVLIEGGKKSPSMRLRHAILEFMERVEREIPSSPWERLRPLRPINPRLTPFIRRVPVLTWASAAQALADSDIKKNAEESVETECKDPNAFAIILEGDSMESKFLAGDRVVLAPGSEPRNGDVVFAKLTDGRVLFKYFYVSGPEGTRVKLVSENSNYKPIEVDRSELSSIYLAWEVKRQLRR